MVTIIIIILTVLFSYKGFQDQSFFYKFDFAPYQVKYNKEYYRFLSHAFLHADWTHLFFNMFVLFNFGGITNIGLQQYSGESLGIFYYLLLYIGGAAFATLTTYKKHQENNNYHSIGASGAVSAVLFSYIIFFPVNGIHLIILPFFDLPAIVWGLIYLAYEQYQSKQSKGNVNHEAHITGAIFGIVFTIVTNPSTATNFYYQLIAYIN